MNTVITRRNIAESDNLTGLSQLLQRVYLARGITNLDQIQYDLKNLLPHKDLKDIDKAAARIGTAIISQQKILIVGDFDTDGATSTAVAINCMREFGAGENIQYIVPSRFAYGYGLTPAIVDVASERNPDVIITVDNGISSCAGVAHANSLGVDVIITDHHLPGKEIPAAFAIVNPNQAGDNFASKNLAGVGVIFYVMLALRAWLLEQDWFNSQGIAIPKMSKFLDLVALGTVADVVTLDKNNRILVQQGIARIRAGVTKPGIKALITASGRNQYSLTTTDLGFGLGPRLNAAGRLDDMSVGIKCLVADNDQDAITIASQLDQYNKERRTIEKKMQDEAFAAIEHLNLAKKLPVGVCLYDENWHQGIVGLVAARVKEKIHRPVIAFAKADDGTLKGSARSVLGLHIRDVLDAIATKNPDLVTKFGGHVMAAGLTIELEQYDEFAKAFATEVGLHLNENDLHGKVYTDGSLSGSELTLQNAELLRDAAPWGQGFPEPVFDNVFKIADQRIVGERHLKMMVQIPDTDIWIDAIAFNVDTNAWPDYGCSQVNLVYKMEVNEYRGRKKLQLIVEKLLGC